MDTTASGVVGDRKVLPCSCSAACISRSGVRVTVWRVAMAWGVFAMCATPIFAEPPPAPPKQPNTPAKSSAAPSSGEQPSIRVVRARQISEQDVAGSRDSRVQIVRPREVTPATSSASSAESARSDRSAASSPSAEQAPPQPGAARTYDPYPRVRRYDDSGNRLAPRVIDRFGGRVRVGPRGYPYPHTPGLDGDFLFRYPGLVDYDALIDAYARGRADEREDVAGAFNEQDMNRRKERALGAHEKSLAIGVAKLRAGNYMEAAIALSLAAELDQGDPACRIHLAQARVALGQYDEAALTLRRALQLQPRLAYLPLRLRDCYPGGDDFDRQVDDLVRHVNGHVATGEVWFLLGVLEFQRGRFAEAHTAFRFADAGLGADDLTQRYLELTIPPRSAPR